MHLPHAFTLTIFDEALIIKYYVFILVVENGTFQTQKSIMHFVKFNINVRVFH